MKMQKKRIVQCGLSLICAFGIALSGMSVHAEEVDSLEDKTSNLQSQLEGINQDLVTISNEIAETEVKIEESNNEVFRLEASLQISRNNEEVQYANMKTQLSTCMKMVRTHCFLWYVKQKYGRVPEPCRLYPEYYKVR